MKIIKEFVSKGLIKKYSQIDFRQILKVLARSNKSIGSARLLEKVDLENS